MGRRLIVCFAGAALIACLSAPFTAALADRKPAPVEFRRGATASGALDEEQQRSPQPPPVEFRRPATPAPQDIWGPGGGAPLSTWALRPEEAAPFDPKSRPQSHVVAAGDTLFSLSVRYQIPLRGLIEANRLEAPFDIEPGRRIILPPPRLHRVGQGETLLTVARACNIDARSLALLNRLEKPYLVRAGDRLALPALARAAAEGAPPKSDPAPGAGKPPQEPAPPGSPSGRTRFAWPLMGPLLTRFGPQSGGKRSDGVDIAAVAGAPVTAAADGRVVYGGDDIAGYGNLLLVQHPGGLISAYAHCSQFAVREGDRVRQGQKLATVARRESGRPRLHFQVRTVAGDPTDPLTFLPPI